jgi:L-lactate dehydrogenase complex protein LldF
MSETQKVFSIDSQRICEDSDRKNILSKNILNYKKKFASSGKIFNNIENAKRKLHYVKYKSIENLEKNLIDFEYKFTERGGKIFYAGNSEKALDYILQILQKHDCKKVVKQKSMVTEEIELNSFLQKHNIQCLETDLGEFIVQLAGEKPSHITAPALHKSKEEIYSLINSKFGENFDNHTRPEFVVRFVRNLLREEFSSAHAGITGANFLIAENGSVVIVENEANGVLSASFPKIHIIVTTIDKIISTGEHLELFQTMLAAHGTGQTLTVYNHTVYGPAKKGEIGGPEQIYLILLNNNRTDIMESVFMRPAVYCIKCGACHNHCPVYNQIGGHAYQSVYNGPIGSVISPFIFGSLEYGFLNYASSLCGKCNEVCPMKIDITSLLIYSRKRLNDNDFNNSSERKRFKKLNKRLLKRKRMQRFSPFLKNIAIRFFLRKSWGKHRDIPVFAKQSFNEIKKQQKTTN